MNPADRETMAGQLAAMLATWKDAREKSARRIMLAKNLQDKRRAEACVGIYDIFIGEVTDLLRRFDWPI